MTKDIETIKEATQEWVKGFNEIPYRVIETLCKYAIDSIYELTKLREGDYIYSYKYNNTGEIEKILKDYLIVNIDGQKVKLKEDDCTIECDSFLPAWGTLWTFGCELDEDWARENIETMSKCGFRVYEQDDFGILIGIDGAGYNFYEAHWIPLYKARGLKWHE